MTVPSVILTDDGATGIIVNEPHRLALFAAALPLEVMLGRNRPHAGRLRAPHLEDFFDLNASALPASTNWRDKAAASIARMYLNDQYGDCVWASNIHLLGVTSANDADGGGVVQATDSEVLSQYHKVCGPGDNGCVITDTLDYGVRTGWTAGGKLYKIDGYAQVDWTKWDLMRACCLYFGGVKIGINLPQAWTSAATWDVTNTGIVGGHDVFVIDYDDSYLYLASWGRIYRMTKAACLSTRWLEEAYVVVAPTWYGADKKAPSGLDYAGLVAAMATIKGGHVPDDPGPIPDPGPTPPPVPPPPAPKKQVAVLPPRVLSGMQRGPLGNHPITVNDPGGTFPIVDAQTLPQGEPMELEERLAHAEAAQRPIGGLIRKYGLEVFQLIPYLLPLIMKNGWQILYNPLIDAWIVAALAALNHGQPIPPVPAI